jgi:regulator of sigma E protease
VRRVAAVRDTDLARRAGLAVGDRILSVGGQPVARPYDFLLRLEAASGPVRIEVERGGSPLALDLAALAAGEAARLARDVALAQDIESNAVAVTPGSAAEAAGLRDLDVIARIDGAEIASFAAIQAAARAVPAERELELAVARGAETFVARVAPRAWHPPDYGLGLRDAQYVYRADGVADALRDGFALSWKFLEESWLTVKRILFRQVSSENIGGIITIGVVSHSFVSDGLAKLFYFLCMLSMNLAFLNVLPIPVLDGGHLVFLLIEKLKGSPVSERIHGYSQLVGVVLLVSLMVYVTFNDVMRWIVN